MSWNDYPTGVKKFLINKLKKKYENSVDTDRCSDDDNLQKIWIRVPYLGRRGEFLVRGCLKKIRLCLTHPVKFIVMYNTKKISYFTSNKDKIPGLSNWFIKLLAGCNKSYIGKTNRCFQKRL